MPLPFRTTKTYYVDEIDEIKRRMHKAEARVAELERVLVEANDIAEKTQKDWKKCIQIMEGPWLLRKQAEAVDAVIKRIREARHEVDRASVDESDTACTLRIAESIAITEAQRLRQQVGEAEKAGGKNEG